jgi:3-methylcrotonyl-CoA carboxylase beta subunit
VACSTVPHIAIVAGDSIGPANFVMGGRSQSPRFMYAWPGARVLQAAAEEEEEVAAAAAAAAAGGSDDAEPAEAALRGTGGAFYGSARLWDDGVITPAETRHTLKLSLEAARCILHERSPPRKAPVFRM